MCSGTSSNPSARAAGSAPPVDPAHLQQKKVKITPSSSMGQHGYSPEGGE